MYLMEREFDQQIGITNSPQTRIPTHERGGWSLIEMVGPADGAKVKELEAAVKQWLKTNNLRIKGTHENWRKDSLTVGSLAEIASIAGVDEWASVW
jgi:predicted GIY-YIG superfamily endonuclease